MANRRICLSKVSVMVMYSGLLVGFVMVGSDLSCFGKEIEVEWWVLWYRYRV